MNVKFLSFLFCTFVLLGLTPKLQGQSNVSPSSNNADTVKSVNLGAPVTPFGDTLFYINARLGAFNPHERAAAATIKIKNLSTNPSFEPDSLEIVESENYADIVFQDIVISSATAGDIKNTSLTQYELAEVRRAAIAKAIKEYRDSTSVISTLKNIGLALAVLAGLFFLIKYINRFFKYLVRRIIALKGSKIKGISIKSYSVLDADKEAAVLAFLVKILRFLTIIIILYLGIMMIFKVFPSTEHVGDKLFGYIIHPIQRMFKGVIGYIPNLITIIVIIAVFRYLIKSLRYFANEVANEKIKINGFYSDWAKPTFNILRALFYAFMFIVIFPYLPGSDSGVFQGVSVFLGIIISLGSTSLIGNLVAGFVLTYMRPFKKGDRIKIGDIVGNVIEKTPFVIRIRTPKNEEITIPNSNIMSAHTINYSKSAQDNGLIIYTTVAFGYAVPWQEVHKLLIEAALKTPNVLDTPKPYVLQTALNDFFVEYQINAFIKMENEMPRIYSGLNQNIQDVFNGAGIELVLPHYYARRDGSEPTIPEQYQAKKN